MRDILSRISVAIVAATLGLVACSSESAGGGDAGLGATCDDNSGPCAPQCIPYALCTSEGSTCVIGGAACGHYWICHDTTWISDTAQDCDSGTTQPDASVSFDASGDASVSFDASADASLSLDASADASLDSPADVTLDAPIESSAADADGDDGG